MPATTEPHSSNDYLASHVSLLLNSYFRLTGRHLLEPMEDSTEMARQINEAAFFVASHDGADDPVLTYGNRCALKLFTMDWMQFIQTPSRFTAEAPNRAERQRLLSSVAEKGYIDDYSGVRISADGRRFRIHQATVWNLHHANGNFAGQAATFSEWEYLD